MSVFRDIRDWFIDFLTFLHEDAHLSFGWAIVAITLMVRLLILPLFLKQYRSMRRMQAYAPQIKELQAKYKGNRQKMNEEMMKFYKENQINPFSSCLPLLAQAPVFIVLYYALREFSQQVGRLDLAPGALEFMWVIPDISVNLLDIGWGAVVLLAIYAISQLLAGELNVTPATAGNQKWLMRFLPFIIVFAVISFPVPAGVVIYWVTTNLWTCGQQLVIKRRIGPNPFLEEATEAAAARPAAKSGSRTPPKEVASAAVAEETTTKPVQPSRRGKSAATPPPDKSTGRRRPRTAPPVAPESTNGVAPASDEVVEDAIEAIEPVDVEPTQQTPSATHPARPPKGATPQRPRGGPAQPARRQPKKKKR
jgi:YidC/Oxa1 family membrane protein insertase